MVCSWPTLLGMLTEGMVWMTCRICWPPAPCVARIEPGERTCRGGGDKDDRFLWSSFNQHHVNISDCCLPWSLWIVPQRGQAWPSDWAGWLCCWAEGWLWCWSRRLCVKTYEVCWGTGPWVGSGPPWDTEKARKVLSYRLESLSLFSGWSAVGSHQAAADTERTTIKGGIKTLEFFRILLRRSRTRTGIIWSSSKQSITTSSGI